MAALTCAPEVQRARCLARPNFTAGKVDMVLSRQVDDAYRRAHADHLVETDADPTETRAQLAAVVAALAEAHADLLSGTAAAPPAPGVACVTFDLDGTFWPTSPPLWEAQDELARLVAEALPKASAAGACTSKALKAAAAKAYEEAPRAAHDLTRVREVSLERIARAHGDEPAAEVAAAVTAGFVAVRSTACNPHVYADVVPALKALRWARPGVAIGTLTNGNCDAAKVDKLAGLHDFCVTARDAGAAKPHLAPFLAAQHKARAVDAARDRVCHASTVHVGDSLKDDVLGALALGQRAVWLDRGDGGGVSASDADVEKLGEYGKERWAKVKSLDELGGVLGGWGGGVDVGLRSGKSGLQLKYYCLGRPLHLRARNIPYTIQKLQFFQGI